MPPKRAHGVNFMRPIKKFILEVFKAFLPNGAGGSFF